jgi:hypothetical protein
MIGTLVLLITGCTDRKLEKMDGAPQVDAPAGETDAYDAGRDSDSDTNGDTDTIGDTKGDTSGDTKGDMNVDTNDDRGTISLDSPTCGTRPGQYGIDILAGSNGCPATLAGLQSRCADSRVQRAACRDYVQVDLAPPAYDPTRTQYRSTCFYAADSMALIGGSISVAFVGEDPPTMTAGEIPLPCGQPCSTAELVCGGPG